MADYIGWDLVYKVSENDINKKEDVLLIAIHYLLIKDGYRAVGLGDDKNLTGNEITTETLPTGWSRDNNYALRYVKNNNLFILRGIPNDDSIVFNFLKVSTLSVTCIVLCPNNVVGELKGDLKTVLPSYEETLVRLKKVLIEGLGKDENESAKEATTQTTPQISLRPTSGIPYEPRRPVSVDPIWSDPERDPLRVGGADLDPFRRGGGGMLFDPFGNRGGIRDPGIGIPGPALPRGAVPPGARFDPFGPPNPRNPPRPRMPPDHDHFGPPGFDGMFM